MISPRPLRSNGVRFGIGATAPVTSDPPATRLKYQSPATIETVTAPDATEPALTEAAQNGELMTLSLRYKQPTAGVSELIEIPVEKSDRPFEEASSDFRFAAAVAAFGMKLRQSIYSGLWKFSDIENAAAASTGEDTQGHRSEMVDLIRQVRQMTGR